MVNITGDFMVVCVHFISETSNSKCIKFTALCKFYAVIWQGTTFQRNLLPSCLEKKTDAGCFSETMLCNYTVWHRKGWNLSSTRCFR